MIPGHGGIMDRFDCQFLMATFVNVYISSFIRTASPAKLLQQVPYTPRDAIRAVKSKKGFRLLSTVHIQLVVGIPKSNQLRKLSFHPLGLQFETGTTIATVQFTPRPSRKQKYFRFKLNLLFHLFVTINACNSRNK